MTTALKYYKIVTVQHFEAFLTRMAAGRAHCGRCARFLHVLVIECRQKPPAALLQESKDSNANIRDAVAAARAELRNQKDQGAGFFKDKKKKSFNPNFDNDNHNRKNRYNSGDKNERGGRGNQGRGNQGRNEGRGRRR